MAPIKKNVKKESPRRSEMDEKAGRTRTGTDGQSYGRNTDRDPDNKKKK